MSFETRESEMHDLARGTYAFISKERRAADVDIDTIQGALLKAYKAGRGDCLAESAATKALLSHELRLIAELLDLHSALLIRMSAPIGLGSFFGLENTKRHRQMIVDIMLWNDKTLTPESPDIREVKNAAVADVRDYLLAIYLAHRIRGILTEEGQ